MPGTGFDWRTERRNYRGLATGIGLLSDTAVENVILAQAIIGVAGEGMFRVTGGLSIVRR